MTDAPRDEPDPPTEDSFVELFSRLVDDAERLVRAELRLYRAQLFARAKEARSAIILLAAAFFIAQSAMVAFLVGLLATLRGPLGPIGATLVVVVGAIAIASLMAWVAIGKIRRATEVRDRDR